MRSRIVWSLIACFIIMCGAANGEVRTYRQVKDVTTTEKGNVRQSSSKGDRFEYTFAVDTAKKTVTRIKVRRLDDPAGRKDATVYTITQERQLMGSEAGNGGPVLVAVQKDGGEILELSNRFAFTMRISPFSQVITGVYKRVYEKDGDNRHHKHR